ncbi:membrane-associated tyrosine- and threonine-specific cdc2-inhibitory kinase-like [Dendronephthya gigantea]|uniref:membrane-associated tyrosine- and threonine-specific cdc2-inhibitory kinase-like n=1 Tax=Dendronephthya gigantea TaxID=151771 RepID=UPI00106CA390|nr:membrane-associated tyrosine- and threonine-specific cdc2-inhibitory kinase-like [Dendronephthya gigantea]
MNEEQDSLLEKVQPSLLRRDYYTEALLGRGAYGVIFKVRCIHDDRPYAIKVVQTTDYNRRNTKYQKRELEILTQYKDELWRKNIVRYYGSWQNHIENTPFLFIQMELCLANLDDYIYDIVGSQVIKVASPKPLWAHVFPQILNGLKAIHQIGWVHRDIHPGNILVANPQPQQITEIVVKIADFGHAREISSIIEGSLQLTVASLLPPLSPQVGNTFFSAPELDTGSYDYKIDLYSAGIVLYFLSRYLPTKSQWPDEIKELRNGNRGPEFLSHQDDILLHLIDDLMKPNPDERPTADMALKFIAVGSLTEKKFLVKKQGDETYYRCTMTENTLKSLKTAIEKHSNIGIKADFQKLQRELIGNDATCTLVDLKSDQDVRQMFLSAREEAEKVSIVVTRSGECDIEEAVNHL